MEVLITIIEFLAILTVVVLVHEFGHFATAKAFGVKVNEFGWGFPPRLVRVFRKGETDYTINLIPLGGFVKLEGEVNPDHPRSLASKGVGTRFIILVAGVVMNVILALVLLAAVFMFTVQEVEVGEVSPGSPADLAGVIAGDVILEVNETSVKSTSDMAPLINQNRGREIEWLIRSEGVERVVRLVPRVNLPPGEGATGIRIGSVGFQQKSPTRPPWEALAMGAEVTWSVPGALKDAVADWINDDGDIPFTGPVGIAQVTGEVAREADNTLVALVVLAAFFSISLAFLNILPIPALDGGRILFVLLEWVRRGKRISPEREGLVHLVGFVVLIVMILGPLTYNDIARLVEGKNFLP